ncbi:FtsK/SpoIIIE domain-containing protein [Paenibacillus sp. GP183]|uniref:FtsK/SpoIIIE domain-containing protein n=1 Tax=Paenibacillus sp. GP183 TaxID=1882751 RepID=UPI0008997CE5|nr:FtsK/SpoIIIE domain-containing protein [Paenibacillus sp. GP183]SEC18000.1 DNA segregation ATPase FtsK/SpoIIIE, S-DNA-T family [Paenibacillus sp. GP183]
MILEVASSAVMAGVFGYTIFDKHGASESVKIQRIANNCGLNVRDNGKVLTIHLLRKTRHIWGTEYAYRLPLGLSFEDVQKKKKHIEDGLNHKRRLLELTLDDLKKLHLRGDILEQIKGLLKGQKHRKEILMEYDGTLLIKVYKEPMPEMVQYDGSTLRSCRGWTVSLGESREESVHHDFDQIPHMVVAGTTRYGKSVFLKNVVTTLIYNKPDDVRFTLIDLKGGLAFNRFSNVRQVLGVAKDVEESLEALRAIHTEIKLRQTEFLRKGFEDVREAGFKKRHFVVIDEAAELASQGEPDKQVKKLKIECEKIVSEIARIGGGLGYRLIFATQYPTADTLPRQVKQNFDARLCFRLQTEIASHVVLDEPGAESLPFVKGRAIYRTDRKQIVQTPFIENEFIDRTIRPHITIKGRKEDGDETGPAKEATARGSHTLIIEEA